MSRDRTKDYVTCAPYVTMATMTVEGKRILGYGPGARVPENLPDADFDHLLSHALICALGEEPVFAVGATADQLAQQARDAEAAARLALAEAVARLDIAKAQREAAEQGAQSERDKADARQKRAEAAALRQAERQLEPDTAAGKQARAGVPGTAPKRPGGRSKGGSSGPPASTGGDQGDGKPAGDDNPSLTPDGQGGSKPDGDGK